MNKDEFIEFLAERRKIKKKSARECVNMVFETLEEAFIDHKDVHINRFGNFVTEKTNPRNGYDFQNKKQIVIDPYWKTTLKLSNIVNEEIKRGQKF